jgi:hypothetical protein
MQSVCPEATAYPTARIARRIVHQWSNRPFFRTLVRGGLKNRSEIVPSPSKLPERQLFPEDCPANAVLNQKTIAAVSLVQSSCVQKSQQ